MLFIYEVMNVSSYPKNRVRIKGEKSFLNNNNKFIILHLPDCVSGLPALPVEDNPWFMLLTPKYMTWIYLLLNSIS